MSKLKLVMALVIAFLWALFSGLLSFAFFELVLAQFGVADFITEDLLRLAIYPTLIFLLVFLIVFMRERPDSDEL